LVFLLVRRQKCRIDTGEWDYFKVIQIGNRIGISNSQKNLDNSAGLTYYFGRMSK
jgi:hypothetical protein